MVCSWPSAAKGLTCDPLDDVDSNCSAVTPVWSTIRRLSRNVSAVSDAPHSKGCTGRLGAVGGASPGNRAALRPLGPLRTGLESFPSSGSSTQKRPLEQRGRSLIPVQNKTYSIRVCGQLARQWINSPGVCEAAPTACAVVICFASFIGSANVLEFEHHREVCSVSGEVMLSQKGNATSICPITGQRSLPRNSDTRTAIDPPYG